MVKTVEPPRRRYVEPEVNAEPGPRTRHYALGASTVLATLTLLALFAAASLPGDHAVHGWWWGFAAVPAALFVLSTVLALRTMRGRASATR
ncbi:MAG TPA: hypothetical protein VFI37_03985 [Gaiellaceae bacterium]|jgi:hypothetical protein|nr:hypothetical protein [Gaiellaceae bacterium]